MNNTQTPDMNTEYSVNDNSQDVTATNVYTQAANAESGTDTRHESKPKPRLNHKIFVAPGFILVILAWVFMIPNFWVSAACLVVGLTMSIIGVRVPPSPRRNFAITAIVAGCVLVVVYALFISLFSIFL